MITMVTNDYKVIMNKVQEIEKKWRGDLIKTISNFNLIAEGIMLTFLALKKRAMNPTMIQRKNEKFHPATSCKLILKESTESTHRHPKTRHRGISSQKFPNIRTKITSSRLLKTFQRAKIRTKLYPVLKTAKKEKISAYFNCDKLIIDEQIYRRPLTSNLALYGPHNEQLDSMVEGLS